MSSIASAWLSRGERTLLDRYSAALASQLGEELRAVWLFGSRARGEVTGDESDVDLLVLVDDDSWSRKERIRAQLHHTAHTLRLGCAGAGRSSRSSSKRWTVTRSSSSASRESTLR